MSKSLNRAQVGVTDEGNDLSALFSDGVYRNVIKETGGTMTGTLTAPEIVVDTQINVVGDGAAGNIYFRTTDDVYTSLLQFYNSVERVGYVGRTSGSSDAMHMVCELGNVVINTPAGKLLANGNEVCDFDNTYNKVSFINTSTGVSDGGKPIVLNAQGQIDPSMLDVSTFY